MQTSVVSAHIMQAIFCRNGTETPEPVKAEVSGAIPPWLQGTLLRNGPGLFSIGNMSYNHWFDGMSLIHSFTFKQGDVYYRSKFLRSDTYMKNITANRIVVSEFGTMAYPDPCKNIFSKAFSYMLSVIPDFTDNNIVNIIRYGDDYYTSSEINYINQINPVTLDTMGRTLFHIIDRKTGLVLNTKFYGDAFVVFHHINAYEEDGHVVFDLITYKDSSVYDLFYIDYMKQDTQKFTEMSKDFSPPVCQRFVIPVNADLKENPLGKNLVRLEGTSATAVFQKDGSLYCTPETLFHGLELPGINYQYNRKKYRYFYGSMMEWSPQANKIAKVDTNTKTHLEWIEEDCYPSEPKFVASPGAVDEDDGVILSSVVSVNPKKSPFMLVLDAKTFKEIARASVNTAVHLDLHGIFIPQESEPK